MSSAQAEELLATVRRDSPEPPAASGGFISIARILLDFADAETGERKERFRRDLEMICHKVAVAKKVLAVYDADWKKTADATPLQTEYWPLLIAVLLVRATHCTRPNYDHRGLGLKCLNSALIALDLAESMDDMKSHREFHDLAGSILAEFSSEVLA